MTLPAVLLALWLLTLTASARADGPADYAFAQDPGALVPAGAAFTESDGRAVRFGDLLGRRPVILALGYFHCPMLCSVVRDDMLEALSHSGMRAGTDYDIAVVSIDPAETRADAARAEAENAGHYAMPGTAPGTTPAGWHFLVGDEAEVASLAAVVGFRSRYDVHLKQFLHPAGLVVLTPEGRVSGYVLGAGYRTGDLKSAVALASGGGIARAALPLLLLCFHFDAETGRYSLEIIKVLRLAGIVTILAIGGTVALAMRADRRRTRA